VSDLHPAGFWRREGAWWLDRLVGGIVWSICSMWLVLGLWALRGLPRDLAGAAVLLVAVGVLAVALHLVYHFAFIGGCGQTPGQMATGIAVVRRDGTAAGYARAAVRSVGGVLSFLTLGLGLVLALFNRERRGLADLVAGTRLILVRPTGRSVHPASSP
jgi:uncharacterized RDD family membrane protein YckC